MKVLPSRYLGPKMNTLADSCKVINAGVVKQRYQTIYNRDGEEGLEPERVKYLTLLNKIKENYDSDTYQKVLARGDDSLLSQPSCLYNPYYPTHNEGTEALIQMGGDALFRLALIDHIKQLQREADVKEFIPQAAQQAVEKVIKWEKAPTPMQDEMEQYEAKAREAERLREEWRQAQELQASPKASPTSVALEKIGKSLDQNKWFILAGAAALFMVLRRR